MGGNGRKLEEKKNIRNLKLLTHAKYYYDDVGRPCGTHEGQENALRILVDKNE
jgi:hypothetical protein